MVTVPRGIDPGTRTRGLVVPAALAAGYVAFALARLSLLPGLGFWDTGEFQAVGPVLGTAHPTGFPAYVLLGWIASIAFAPLGDPAFRMNLLSAVLVGGATGATVILVQQVSGRVWIALAMGLVMAAIPIVWGIGTHADPHALHVLLVPVLLSLLFGWGQRVRRAAEDAAAAGAAPVAPAGRLAAQGDRWLLAAAVVFGISLANHTLTLLLAPGIGLYLLATDRAILQRTRLVAGMAGVILLTAGILYLELPLRAGILRAPLVYGHPDRLDGFLYVVFAQQFLGSLYQPFSDLGEKTLALGRLGYEQLGLLAALIPLAFVVTMKRQPRYALLTGVSFLITVWFAASYVNGDIARYYLGPAVMALTWLGLLAAEVLERAERILGLETSGIAAPALAVIRRRGRPGVAGAAAFLLELGLGAVLLLPTLQALPARGATEDLSQDRGASDWAHAAMDTMAPDAVVVSWWSYSTTLWYVQFVEGRRPDVWIVDDRTRLDENLGDVTDVIEAQLDKRPVYVIRGAGDEDLAVIRERYDVQEFPMPTDQSLLRILGRKVP
jgi:hypothetical protein